MLNNTELHSPHFVLYNTTDNLYKYNVGDVNDSCIYQRQKNKNKKKLKKIEMEYTGLWYLQLQLLPATTDFFFWIYDSWL